MINCFWIQRWKISLASSYSFVKDAPLIIIFKKANIDIIIRPMPGKKFCIPLFVDFISCGVFSPTFIHFPQPHSKQHQCAGDMRLPDTSQHPVSHTLMRLTSITESNEVYEFYNNLNQFPLLLSIPFAMSIKLFFCIGILMMQGA